MRNLKAANVYAKALYESAQAKNLVDDVTKDLSLFVNTLDADLNVKQRLLSPVISRAQKVQVIQNSFAGKCSKLGIDFFSLLSSKGRLNLAAEILDRLNSIVEKDRGILRAIIRSAIALSPTQLASIEQILARQFPGKKFLSLCEIDPDLIGGFTVQVGDTIIDASIRQKLMQLKRKLAA